MHGGENILKEFCPGLCFTEVVDLTHVAWLYKPLFYILGTFYS